MRGARIADWKFTEDGTSEVVRRSTNAGAAIWSGTMVTSGTVSVNVTQGGRTISLSKTVMVNARTDFAFQAVQPVKKPNGFVAEDGSTISVPNPPIPDKEAGFARQFQAYLPSYGIVNDGPNQGFRYVTAMSDSYTDPKSGKFMPTYFYYVIAPDLENTNSDFYRNQCGNYDETTNRGFISGAQLLENTIHHESGTDKNSHYFFYVTSQNNPVNNIGLVGEKVVGRPSESLDNFIKKVDDSLSDAAQRINKDIAVEPCGASDVRRDANCKFRGFVNFPPYKSCTKENSVFNVKERKKK